MIEDVTNSPKDWNDFWYQSPDKNGNLITCTIDDVPVDCITWQPPNPSDKTMLHMTQSPDQKLKERQELCHDLEYLITQDKDIREELIDEYVYLLSDDRVAELRQVCNSELDVDLEEN